jgi:hypothetical protein
MSTKNQIPLHFQWLGSDGKLTQQAAFYLQQLGTAGSSGTANIFIGPDADRGTPAFGDIYFADDTGLIYVGTNVSWLVQLPAFTGDVTSSIGSTDLTLNTVNLNPGTYSNATVTVNSKGLVIDVAAGTGGSGAPAGLSNDVQFNLTGAFAADTGNFDYDPTTHTLSIGGQITFTTPATTLNNLLPTQTGNAGDFLTTNGTNASWVAGGSVSSVGFSAGTGIGLSGTNPITSSGTITITNDGVTSIAGTANEITASASTGAVTLSLPSAIITPGTLEVQGQAYTPPNTVTFGSTININVALSNVFYVTLTGNITSVTGTGGVDGQTINIIFIQDSSGGHTIVWPSTFKWPGGVAGTLSTAPNAVDLLVATRSSISGGIWLVTLLNAFS